jgi:hypothetical protein
VIIHTLPFLLRDSNDLKLADDCFQSLQNTDAICIVILFNQGYMNNIELKKYLENYRIDFHILGDGSNEGIPRARQKCMEYIWQNYPHCRFISEIHLDMIFPKDWHRPLTEYLSKHDEPMICPGIITQFGEIHPLKKNVKSLEIPSGYQAIIQLCEKLEEDKVVEGFVHPVVHRVDSLKKIGGYDVRVLKGKQGYEDDSILLGYRYFMGIRTNWKPKSYLASYVFHATLAQRTTLCSVSEEFMINLNGLFKQYGAYGFLQLAEIHNNEEFLRIANSVLE